MSDVHVLGESILCLTVHSLEDTCVISSLGLLCTNLLWISFHFFKSLECYLSIIWESHTRPTMHFDQIDPFPPQLLSWPPALDLQEILSANILAWIGEGPWGCTLTESYWAIARSSYLGRASQFSLGLLPMVSHVPVDGPITVHIWIVLIGLSAS